MIIEITYGKRCGLPRYSSHSFAVSVKAEVTSLRRLEAESSRLYRLLQEIVDREVQQVGFLPDITYGMMVDAPAVTNGESKSGAPKPAVRRSRLPVLPADGSWACSDKQKDLIQKVAKREKFTEADLEGIAQRLFGLPLQRLDKKQASAFITELFAIAGPPRFRAAASRPPLAAAGDSNAAPVS